MRKQTQATPQQVISAPKMAKVLARSMKKYTLIMRPRGLSGTMLRSLIACF